MAPPPPPPPPPPPLCLPFTKKKPRRLTYPERDGTESFNSQRSSIERLRRADSYSPTATLTSHAEKLTFSSDSEAYSAVPSFHNEAREVKPGLKRSNTIANPKSTKSKELSNAGGGSRKWGYGYGWGIGKKDKEKERERELEQQRERELGTSSQNSRPPMYQSPRPSQSSAASPYRDYDPQMQQPTRDLVSLTSGGHSAQPSRSNTYRSTNTQSSSQSKQSKASGSGTRFVEPAQAFGSNSLTRRPALYPSESSSTLVGSALERKVNDVDTFKRFDTTERLDSLRELMKKDSLDY